VRIHGEWPSGRYRRQEEQSVSKRERERERERGYEREGLGDRVREVDDTWSQGPCGPLTL
jgi:hypothetical protein